ncbi:Z1 domain-containing protein [Chloroflexota bacterium]
MVNNDNPSHNNDQEIVEMQPQALPPGIRWQPTVGEETRQLLDTLTLEDQERERLLEESLTVLAKCVPPTDNCGTDTGLVIGNIQSGKTTSFTTVSALARDNNFRLIILITGTKKILFNQSINRISNLLRISSRRDWAWLMYRNPSVSQAREISETLDDWRAEYRHGIPPQTILITLLKNHAQLRKLSRLLERLNLDDCPALIIDDEADQAGLNTDARRGSQSPTYRELTQVRQALPHHTYLGYTATPQAPLLINILSALSPSFGQVLTPGLRYTGGQAFFQYAPPLIQIIPDTEVPSRNNHLHEPPDSLLEAMRIYFLGVAAGMSELQGQAQSHNRSMLVHPSQLTASHAQFFQWVQAIKNSWSRILDLPIDEPDRQLLISEFSVAYQQLMATKSDLPDFDDLMQLLPQVIRRTRVREVNTRSGNISPDINDIDEFWRQNYSYILVGGQSLERGFTVEGLTVTYMPRGIGAGTADTIQQRARFYGYHQEYLGYSRIYLEHAARDSYESLVEHEDDLMGRLANYCVSGSPLTEWRRIFFLDRRLKPTRDSVLDVDYERGPTTNEWYAPLPPLYSLEDLNTNRGLVDEFLRSLSLEPDSGDERRTQAQRHLVATGVPLMDVLASLLIPLRVTDPDDAADLLCIMLQIQRYLEEHPESTCTIYHMRPTMATSERRSLGGDGRINPFQGANLPTGYPGDRAIKASQGVSIQIHKLPTVYESRQSEVIVAEDVPIIGIWFPGEISRGIVIQDQGGS